MIRLVNVFTALSQWLRVNRASADATEILRAQERRLLQLVRRLRSKERATVQGGLACALLGEPIRVKTPKGPLLFAVLGKRSALRGISLLTKQRATIAWIDNFRPNSVFWDIGANVGAYTLYAALRPDIRVVAFEPAAVNHFLLAANCELNGFTERVDCLQIGLGHAKEVGRLEISQFEPAQSFSFRGKRRRPFTSRQAALVLSMDQLIEEYGLPLPNYIKIDVPAMTGTIIEGGARTLACPEVQELHIETSEHSKGGPWLVEQLAQAGFGIAGRHVREGATDLTFARELLKTGTQ